MKLQLILIILMFLSITQTKRPKNPKTKISNWENSLYLALLVENDHVLKEEIAKNLQKLTLNPACFNSVFCKSTVENTFLLKTKPGFRYPNNFHSTLYFKGRQEFDKENQAFQGFIENKIVDIEVVGIGIIPNYLVTLLVDYPAFSDNSYKHITFMLGNKAKAVESNYFFEGIFSEGRYLNEEYLNKFEGSNGKLFIFEEEVLGRDQEVIFYVLEEKIRISSLMKGMN